MHKLFALRLSSFVLTGLLASCLLLLGSCSFNPNYQGKGLPILQGEWQQDSIAGQKQLVSYTLYHFTFSCDSFFVRMENFSKVNYGSDTCMKSGHWFEYSKGVYEMRRDTLHLKGFYALQNFKLKEAGGCFNFGVYEDFFKITGHTDSSLNMASLSNTIVVKAKLIKRITCVPKPL